MKKQTFVWAWMAIAMLVIGFPLAVPAQSAGVFSFLSPPYAAAYGDVMDSDGLSVASVEKILSYDRSNQSDVDVIFLSDRFYVVLDLMGMRRAYIFTYDDDFAGYANQLDLSGIPGNQLTVTELIDCVLKYHTQN